MSTALITMAEEIASLRLELAATRAQLELTEAVMTSGHGAPTTAVDEEGFEKCFFGTYDASALGTVGADGEARDRNVDSAYFDSYSHVAIHETMLRDEVRTGAHAAAITPGHFAGKVVLDVGCGTGILSMLAARAGAARVIGVDASPAIIDSARVAVAANGLAGAVRLVSGRIEDLSRADLELAEGEAVGIVLSEWMGYCLLFESMLPSVLGARDRFMRSGGTMWPSQVRLFIEAWSDRTPDAYDLGTFPSPGGRFSGEVGSAGGGGSSGGGGVGSGARRGSAWWQAVQGKPGAGRLAWWRRVHGLDMSCFAPLVLGSASFEAVAPACVVSSRGRLWEVDLNACDGTTAGLGITDAPFEMTVQGGPAMLDGFVVAFDVAFRHPGEGGTPVDVLLSTGADGPATHWKQTLFLLDPHQAPRSPLLVGTVVCGKFSMRRSAANPRCYDAAISWAVGDLSGSQTYNIST